MRSSAGSLVKAGAKAGAFFAGVSFMLKIRISQGAVIID